MTKHAEDRLANRVKPQHKAVAVGLIDKAYSCPSAALVALIDPKTALVVIARAYTPVTVMYARSEQITLSHLRVDSIITE